MQPDSKTLQITLAVTVDEANLLIAGLGKLPLEASVQLWMKIREQAAWQLQTEAQPEAPMGKAEFTD